MKQRSWDKAQVQALREGDALVWEAFVDDFGARIYRYFRNTSSAELADDLVSDTFCAILAQLPSFREDAQLGTWVYAICRNKLYTRLGLRKRWRDLLSRTLPLLAPTPTEDPESAFLRMDALSQMEQAMETLPTLYREVLTLRHIEELSIKEVAEILDISESRVKNTTRAGKERLFQLLEKSNHKALPQSPWHNDDIAKESQQSDEERSAS